MHVSLQLAQASESATIQAARSTFTSHPYDHARCEYAARHGARACAGQTAVSSVRLSIHSPASAARCAQYRAPRTVNEHLQYLAAHLLPCHCDTRRVLSLTWLPSRSIVDTAAPPSLWTGCPALPLPLSELSIRCYRPGCAVR
jgi:hypothetical protein